MSWARHAQSTVPRRWASSPPWWTGRSGPQPPLLVPLFELWAEEAAHTGRTRSGKLLSDRVDSRDPRLLQGPRRLKPSVLPATQGQQGLRGNRARESWPVNI